jgi:hypothetical protein
MLLNKKSALKSHLSSKHPTFSHKVMAKPTHEPTETEVKRVARAGSDPPPMEVQR